MTEYPANSIIIYLFFSNQEETIPGGGGYVARTRFFSILLYIPLGLPVIPLLAYAVFAARRHKSGMTQQVRDEDSNDSRPGTTDSHGSQMAVTCWGLSMGFALVFDIFRRLNSRDGGVKGPGYLHRAPVGGKQMRVAMGLASPGFPCVSYHLAFPP